MISEDKCGLSSETQKKLKIIFSLNEKIEKVILYGSRAMGNFKVGSDIDFTIKSTSLSIAELFKIENEIDDLLLPYKIDISLYNQIDNKDLLHHINKFGIVFYFK